MKSMTGYGRGELSEDGFKITVECSSVNRKQTEINVSLPRELEILEAQIRDEVNRTISRGRLTVKVSLHTAEENSGNQVRVNIDLAKAYAREYRKLATALKMSGAETFNLIVQSPGVLHTAGEVDDAENLWPAVEKALKLAMAALVKMRAREGENLGKDLKKRVKTMQEAVKRVEKRAPEVVTRYRDQLRERIRGAGLESPPADDERLAKEITYFADRSDITEELTRLHSHFQQFEECCRSGEPVGRTLDFLSQEMNREINTIGSKANDSVISREVVNLKAELERFREQVQNVE